jgi:hypothetical protein
MAYILDVLAQRGSAPVPAPVDVPQVRPAKSDAQ